jgi:hypothetical protein
MDQREFPFLARVGAPSVAPEQWVRYCKTYRQAVKVAFELRRDGVSKRDLATDARLTVQHVSDYLAKDDKPFRRSLPASKVADFERVVGNTLVSQWLAAQSRLTVLEEMQATRAVA